MTFSPGTRVRLTRRAFAALRKGGTFSADELYDLVRGTEVLGPFTPDHVRVLAGSLEPGGPPRIQIHVWVGYLQEDI